MKKQLLAAAVLCAVSFGAFAAEPSYTYVQAGASRNNIDLGTSIDSIDFDGWHIAGSYGFNDFHVFGGYEKTTNDDFIDMDLDQSQLGFGWHPSISDNADAILELSYVHQKVKASAFGMSATDNSDGYKASAGFRAAFNDYVVGNIKANYTDTTDGGSEFSPSFGLEVRFNPMWSLVGDAEVGREVKHYTVGVRASF